MQIKEKRIVLSTGARTPIGHIGKSLAEFSPEKLMSHVIKSLIQHSNLYPHSVDGVIVGWVGQGSHAPNIARISMLLADLPEKSHAFTVQANCVSGMESISSAARHILLGEGKLYIAGGTESMSTFPYTIRGNRGHKELKSLENLKNAWNDLWNHSEIAITDTIEEGLCDPVKKINMAVTAEICAQTYSITRAQQDEYAFQSYKRTLKAQEDGFYKSHLYPIAELQKDEYPYLRENLVKKPEMLSKAPLLFDNPSFSIKDFYESYGKFIYGKTYSEGKTQATVTLFNSCARSDGASAIIVTDEVTAKNLDLEILAEVLSWGYWGNNPAYMGLGPVFATEVALNRVGINFDDLSYIELHEAFAATCLSVFKVGQEKYGHNWYKYWKDGRLNPNGGSLALGHPLAATGTRLVLNLVYQMKKDPTATYGLATACASGGLGGAIILKKM